MKFIKSIVFILIQTACFGQSTSTVTISLTLPDIASIALSDNSAVNLTGTSSLAGNPISFTTNTTKWIYFTSAVVSTGATRTITAQITSGSIPSGMNLKLTTKPVSGTGLGSRGTNVSSSINLSSSPQTIISLIGGGYTGQGSSDGYNLKFELDIIDFSKIRAENTSLTITFTIN